jgi:hypothetical protein
MLLLTGAARKLVGHMSSARLEGLDLGTFSDCTEACAAIDGLPRSAVSGVRKLSMCVALHAEGSALMMRAIAAAMPRLESLRYVASVLGPDRGAASVISDVLQSVSGGSMIRMSSINRIDLVVSVWVPAEDTVGACGGHPMQPPSEIVVSVDDATTRCPSALESFSIHVGFEDAVADPHRGLRGIEEAARGKLARDAFDAAVSGIGASNASATIRSLEFEAFGYGGTIAFSPPRWPPSMPALKQLIAPNVMVGASRPSGALWASAPSLEAVRLWSAAVRDAPSLRTLTLSKNGFAEGGIELLEFPPGPAARAYVSDVEAQAPSIEFVAITGQTSCFGSVGCGSSPSSWSSHWGTGGETGVAMRVEFERRRPRSESVGSLWAALYTACDLGVIPYVIS